MENLFNKVPRRCLRFFFCSMIPIPNFLFLFYYPNYSYILMMVCSRLNMAQIFYFLLSLLYPFDWSKNDDGWWSVDWIFCFCFEPMKFHFFIYLLSVWIFCFVYPEKKFPRIVFFFSSTHWIWKASLFLLILFLFLGHHHHHHHYHYHKHEWTNQ